MADNFDDNDGATYDDDPDDLTDVKETVESKIYNKSNSKKDYTRKGITLLLALG